MTESAAQQQDKPAAAAKEPAQKKEEALPEAPEAAPASEAPQKPAEKSAEQLLKEQLEAAEKKIAENYDLYVRAMADLENTRKRANAEVLKAHKYGIEKFAANLLPVIDSFEKAIDHAADDQGPLKEGLLAVYRQMVHAMEISGMKCFDPKGQKFDPNFHQAVSMVPASESAAPGTVAVVFQKGWMIQERVLRPAMVAVAQG